MTMMESYRKTGQVSHSATIDDYESSSEASLTARPSLTQVKKAMRINQAAAWEHPLREM